MKVLHVISSIDPKNGGVSTALGLIADGLSDFGFTSEILTIDSPDAPFLLALSDKYTIRAVGPSKTPWLYTPNMIPWLLDNLGKFDFVVIHGLWLYHGYAVTLAMKQLSKFANNNKMQLPKVYVMPHGMLDPYFQKAKERRLKAIRNWILWHLIEHKVINNAAGLFFTCEMEKILARKTFKQYYPKSEEVVGLGIEAPQPYSIAMKNALDMKLGKPLENYWLFFSRVHEKKGIDILLQAYLSLKKTHSNVPPLVIAGPGLETDFGQGILEMAKGEPDVYFTGMLEGDTKWGALYGCELFILPSHQENFGIAIVEALACSKPVIITNKVNIWQEVKQNGGGMIINDEFDSLYEALEKWLGYGYEQKQLISEMAYQSYFQNFTIMRMSEKMNFVFRLNR